MTDRDDRLDINTLGSLGAGHPSHVTVRRAVLAEALEQIEATWCHEFGRCTGTPCDEYFGTPKDIATHAPGCRYIHTRDALRKALASR